MSEDNKPLEKNVAFWSPPLPWLAPHCISSKNNKEVIVEVSKKEEETKTKD